MASPAAPDSRALSLTPGARVLQSTLSNESIWKRLREGGFDEESIKIMDKAALISYISKLEAEERRWYNSSVSSRGKCTEDENGCREDVHAIPNCRAICGGCEGNCVSKQMLVWDGYLVVFKSRFMKSRMFHHTRKVWHRLI